MYPAPHMTHVSSSSYDTCIRVVPTQRHQKTNPPGYGGAPGVSLTKREGERHKGRERAQASPSTRKKRHKNKPGNKGRERAQALNKKKKTKTNLETKVGRGPRRLPQQKKKDTKTNLETKVGRGPRRLPEQKKFKKDLDTQVGRGPRCLPQQLHQPLNVEQE